MEEEEKWVRMLPWAILIALIIALLFGILLQGFGPGGGGGGGYYAGMGG